MSFVVAYYNFGNEEYEKFVNPALEGVEDALENYIHNDLSFVHGEELDSQSVSSAMKDAETSEGISGNRAMKDLLKIQQEYAQNYQDLKSNNQKVPRKYIPHWKVVLVPEELRAPNMRALAVQSGLKNNHSRDCLVISSYMINSKTDITQEVISNTDIKHQDLAEIRLFLLGYHETAHAFGTSHCRTPGCIHSDFTIENDSPLKNLDKIMLKFLKNRRDIWGCGQH